jgi:PAS domain S-box-containing protein
MKESLQRVANEDKQRNWVNQGFAKFGDILRSNHDNLSKLSEEILSNIVEYLDANQGVIYQKVKVGTEDDQEDFRMRATACYAFNKKKKLESEVMMGEGMVGAAWQENDTIFLTEIPDEYIKIRSGLGDAPPKSILIQPLETNEELVGVLELASFNKFEDYQIEFIKKVSENIAATVAMVQNNMRNKELLEESKQMAEEMKAQEEELRQNMEELEATQEEMRRAQDEIKRKEANLTALIDNTEDTIFAINRDYEITVVNKTLREKYVKLGIDLRVGKNIFEVLPEELRAHWKERYDRALAGEKFTKLEESKGTAGRKFVETHHNPIKDELGNVIGCSVIAKDVTETMEMQEKIHEKESILSSLIDNTDDTYFALDRDYRITVVNRALRERFEKTGITMQPGDDIFEILPKEAHELWKDKYDRALAGESFQFFQERPVNDEVLYLVAYCNPVKNENDEIIGASVQSKDITKWRKAELENEELKKQVVGLKKKSGEKLSAEEEKLANS